MSDHTTASIDPHRAPDRVTPQTQGPDVQWAAATEFGAPTAVRLPPRADGGAEILPLLRQLAPSQRPAAVLGLQRTIGNARVQRLLTPPDRSPAATTVVRRSPPRHHGPAPSAGSHSAGYQWVLRRLTNLQLRAQTLPAIEPVLGHWAAELRALVGPPPETVELVFPPPLDERIDVRPSEVSALLCIADPTTCTTSLPPPVSSPSPTPEPVAALFAPQFEAQVSPSGGTLTYGRGPRIVLTAASPAGERPAFAYEYLQPTSGRSYAVIRIVAAPGVDVRLEGFPADFGPTHRMVTRYVPLVEIYRVQDLSQVPTQGEPIVPDQFAATSAVMPRAQTPLGPVLPLGMGRILATQLPNGVELIPEQPGRYRNEGADPNSEVNRNLGRAGHALGNVTRNVQALLQGREAPGWESAPEHALVRRGLRITVPPGRADARFAYEVDYSLHYRGQTTPTVRVVKTPSVSVTLFGANPEAFPDFTWEITEVAQPAQVPAQNASLASISGRRVTVIRADIALTPYQVRRRFAQVPIVPVRPVCADLSRHDGRFVDDLIHAGPIQSRPFGVNIGVTLPGWCHRRPARRGRRTRRCSMTRSSRCGTPLAPTSPRP